MSRILRRPMFRGGRVDSRGTGITSGLGYAKGGSVNTPKRGLVNGPGGYAGDGWSFFGGHVDQDKLNKIMGPGGTLIGDANRGLTGINDLLYNYIARPAGNVPYWLSDYVLGTDFGMPIQKKDSFKEWVGMAPEEPIITDSGAIPKAIKQQENAILLEELEAEKNKEKSLEEIMKEMMGPQQSKKEKIEEYKEIFKDAYGSGVADDASRMLLSAAGRLLEPEATVKSAAGKFFADESKVESKRTKYKDAATTAAINAYLTGEKDYQSLMNQMTLIDHQLKRKEDFATSKKTIDNLLSAYASGAKDDRTDPGVMQAAYNDLFKSQIFEGPVPENKDGTVNEDELMVGKIYYQDHPTDSRNKIIFLVKADGSLKQINTILK